jgi:hypothetical protein
MGVDSANRPRKADLALWPMGYPARAAVAHGANRYGAGSAGTGESLAHEATASRVVRHTSTYPYY